MLLVSQTFNISKQGDKDGVLVPDFKGPSSPAKKILILPTDDIVHETKKQTNVYCSFVAFVHKRK